MSEVAGPVTSETAPSRPFRLKRRANERVKLLGETMDLVRHEEVFHYVAGRLNRGVSSVIANHNLHSLYLIQKSGKIRDFFRAADLVEVDSTPLLLWARIIGRSSRQFHRCTYLDWRDFFWERARTENWRVFFLGGEPGVAETAREKILADWPGVQLEVRDGYFDATPGSAENTAAVDAINAYQPHILLVGMGMPRQEIWVLENHKAIISPCAHFTVGGAFDYEAGVQTPAPRWMGRMGVEWLFRLMSDPSRLFSRYCVEPWFLIAPALRDLKTAYIDKPARAPNGATALPG